MSSGDVSALLDIAAAPSPSVTPESTSTPEPVVEETVDTETSETSDSEQPVAESEGERGEQSQTDDAPIDARTNPAAVRSALKALRDLDPKYASIARHLNNEFGRAQAYRAAFPKVADAQNAKALMDAVGGGDGLTSLQESLKSVQATDQKLYNGDGTVLDDILADMKAAGKQDAFAKLADPFIERLQKNFPEAFTEAFKPHFYEGVKNSGFPDVVESLAATLSGETPDLKTATALVKEMQKWYGNLEKGVSQSKKTSLDPERQAFERERTEFQTAKQKEFQTAVATSCEGHNNRTLGTELKAYLKMPFFQKFTRASLEDLGSGIKGRLMSELSADKQYQSQMDAFWSQPNPDKAKIESFHKAKVESMSRRIVKTVLETRYPNFGAQGSAAGAKAAGQKVTPKPGQPTQTLQAGKPAFVTSKPDREAIDWNKTTDLLFITGRAYLKGGKYVAWSPKFR